ncbi:hypothetical protein [Anatilimnocola floriformis]|uniref:hypothetical protein n=1 Tax=Anatilimnocola floriformis TaxID=2948575 RepID=UPI0020C2688F|nr:hypothetical protein [Anatilimnocola floriformis]
MDDIQFGDVEEVQPEKNLRPDRNRHFAVVSYGNPNERELPIFVDLDVLLDMEQHAASDKTVELGGVMLGGHYHDSDGKPFVVVTDSLRAEHYESTKGSFKFTHETWEKISRQREEFPPELQMAGWYHTHPDWGVFLSGMDMFICDNFFNKKLDVAYVIDPCRLDRAFFQWTEHASDERMKREPRRGDPARTQRTGGFYVMASRFREQELVTAVAALEGKTPMPTYSSGGGNGSPIINVQSPPPPPKPAWETAGMFGMLALQFCLLALIAVKMMSPAEPPANSDALTKLEKLIETRDETARLIELHKRDLQTVDRVLHEVQRTPKGLVEAYDLQQKENERLALALSNSEFVQHKLQEETANSLAEMKAELALRSVQIEKVELALKNLGEQKSKLKDDLLARDTTIKELKAKLEPEEKTTASDRGIFAWPPTRQTYLVFGGVVIAGIIGGVGLWLRFQDNAGQGKDGPNESLSEPPYGRSPLVDPPREPAPRDPLPREPVVREAAPANEIPAPKSEPEKTAP